MGTHFFLVPVNGAKRAGWDASAESRCVGTMYKRPSESERRQGRAIWYSRPPLRLAGRRAVEMRAGRRDPSTALGMPGRAAKAKCRSLDCAPFVPQGKRDDKRSATSSAKCKEPARCPSAPLRTSLRYKRKDNSCEVR
jgi:hypothetical protein